MSDRWALPPLSVGEFAPEFFAPTRANPAFHFNTVAGRYVLLGLMPRDRAAEAEAAAALDQIRAQLNDRHVCGMMISPQGDFADVPPDVVPGVRWFLDPDRKVAALFGSEPGWWLLDPTLRVMASLPLKETQAMLRHVASLPPVPMHAGAPLIAPVLIVPRVFEPEFCRKLIAYYDAQGGQRSGVMRDIGGRTVGVLDGMKSRRDVNVTDPELKNAILTGLDRNLGGMIRRAFHFNPTRLERYLIACYDAGEGGFFRPHRDNLSMATAHRKFAVSINLNAEEFEGGDLRFPEFGPRTYRPPTGGAVVFCCSLLHEATPVTQGRRYAVLPFLYDAAGEVIRQRNIDKLDTGPALRMDTR